MQTNKEKKATVVADNREISVYKLKEGTPTKEHIWCNCSGCTETFLEKQLKFHS